MLEGWKRGDATAAVEDDEGREHRRGSKKERIECVSHPPLCVRASSRYIRPNCICAEECRCTVIYVRGFNTSYPYGTSVAQNFVSPSENDDHMVAENDTLSFSHFFIFSFGPNAALNSRAKKATSCYITIVSVERRAFPKSQRYIQRAEKPRFLYRNNISITCSNSVDFT